jgi:hypothetical protein
MRPRRRGIISELAKSYHYHREIPDLRPANPVAGRAWFLGRSFREVEPVQVNRSGVAEQVDLHAFAVAEECLG